MELIFYSDVLYSDEIWEIKKLDIVFPENMSKENFAAYINCNINRIDFNDISKGKIFIYFRSSYDFEQWFSKVYSKSSLVRNQKIVNFNKLDS